MKGKVRAEKTMDKRLVIRFLRSCCDNRKSKTRPEPLSYAQVKLRRGIQNQKWLGLSIIALVLVVAWTAAQAQQPAKVPRIGFLSASGNPTSVEAFRQGLRDLGYIEGKTILVEYRDVEGKPDRSPSLVAELVQLKVDVLVAPPLTAIRAAKEATRRFQLSW